jgi:hypothetical protein
MQENEEWIKPETTENFEELSRKAYEYLNEQQDLCEATYGIAKYESWYYDQHLGELTFSDAGVVKIKIQYEEVGSVSKVTDTWLWSWANQHLEEKIKTDILKVKNFGIENDLQLLTKSKWYADQYDGWEMTAIASYLMKAKGAYRVPLKNTYSFMIFKEVQDMRIDNDA